MNTMFTIEENMKMNSIDQIKMQLTFKTPDSRRNIVNAWNVGVETKWFFHLVIIFPILHKRVEF
jgi:hypothetical protein